MKQQTKYFKVLKVLNKKIQLKRHSGPPIKTDVNKYFIMSTKTIKREKIYLSFDQELYNIVRNAENEKVRHLNNAIEELEAIIKKPIDDYKAFSKDILSYSLEAIKKTYPKPFDLDLGNEATLKMLSIDLSKLKDCAREWDVNTEFTIMDNYARIEVDQESFKQYCESEEQFKRFDFAMQCIDTIQKAVSYATFLRPQDLASFYKYFIEYSFDIDGKVTLSPRNSFVLTGH